MKLKKEKDQIIFIYNPYHGDIYWVQREFGEDEEKLVNLAGTFYFKKDDVLKIGKDSIEFKLAKLEENYFKIDGRVLGVKFNVFLYKDLDIDFKTISCAKGKNIFQFISEFRKVNEDIYIDGNNSTLDYKDLENLVNQFPSRYEKELYNKARISQVLENYFDNIENYTYKLNNYREKKGYTKHSNHILYTEYDILKSADSVNFKQREVFIKKIEQYYNNNIKGKTFAVWGLAFKPNTNDMREAPAITIINHLLDKGAKINAYDPKAMESAKMIFGDKIIYANSSYDALKDTDALILITEWNEFRRPDFNRIRDILNDKIIFDGRNIYDRNILESIGLKYIRIG